MWIKKQVLDDLRRTASSLETLAKQYYDAIGLRDKEITRLRQRELDLLHDVGLQIANAARATTSADMWRVRVNELTIERAALLQLALPNLKTSIPVVERDPVTTAPGIDFEDMGDAAARMTGALVGDGELRVDAPAPASIKGAPMFRDPAEPDLD